MKKVNQEIILHDMQKLINKIRQARDITGDNPVNHEAISEEISMLYKKLDYKHQEEFNDYLN